MEGIQPKAEDDIAEWWTNDIAIKDRNTKKIYQAFLKSYKNKNERRTRNS